VFNQEEDTDMENLYKVTIYKKDETKPRAGKYTLQSISNHEDVLEMGGDELVDCWMTLPPPHVRNRWERYQNQPVTEGVWMSTIDQTLHDMLNAQIDELAAKEPVDWHPGTGDIVRDLVHPSLYPLLLDASSLDTSQRNYWNRPYEASRFQWLPAEVEVDIEGKARFTSPINNLDRAEYPGLVNSLETLFTALLPGFAKVWEYAQYISFVEESEDWEDTGYGPVSSPMSFHETGLQTVVKIADYVFAPGASFSGVWHYEGMAHEHIVMTGLFYPYSDGLLTGGGLEFKRQFTDAEAGKMLYNMPQCRPFWLNDLIATGFVPLGCTTTETGKCMVFPNCHAHRVMEIVNETEETLRRRLVVFFVIDPNHRITSSKDVNPLPRQVSLQTALADRLELMQERKQAKQALNPREIELCEH